MAVAVAPQLLFAVWLAGSSLLGLVHRDPFWREEQVSLSEAILRGDYGQAMRLAIEGHDLNVPYPIGRSAPPGVTEMTPLDAAAHEGEIDVVKALLRQGLVADDAARRRAACIAVGREAADVAAFLVGRVVTQQECAAGAEDQR